MWYMWGRRVITGLWWRNLKEKGHMEHLGVYGRIIVTCVLQKYRGVDVDWLHVPEDGDM